MNEIFFLIFAFLTVFLSIKLSYYAEGLSKTSNISKALVGGLILAGVTSLPELVTCFSAILVNNKALAIGDILGSNLFNIFMVSFFDLVFIKKLIFTETSKSHNLVLLILLINYIFLYIYIKQILDIALFSIGLPTIIIILTYIFYIKSIPKYEQEDKIKINNKDLSQQLTIKLIVASILMIMSSTFLTIIVNNLSMEHPSFCSSFIGAIFLGITTSLPEVVTFYTLISINSYDLALSNILGSNIFNLLVLSLGDFISTNKPIYDYKDKDTSILIILGIIFIIISLLSNRKIKSIPYGILSAIIVVIYLFFWIFRFLG